MDPLWDEPGTIAESRVRLLTDGFVIAVSAYGRGYERELEVGDAVVLVHSWPSAPFPTDALQNAVMPGGRKRGVSADVLAKQVDAVFANASAAILDVYLRMRFHAPHLLGFSAPLEGRFEPSASVFRKLESGESGGHWGNTFAVPHPDRGAEQPPCGFVCGGSRAWVFDADQVERVRRAAWFAAGGVHVEPKTAMVRPARRVAWCAHVAGGGGGGGGGNNEGLRRVFFDSMMRARSTWERQWTGRTAAVSATLGMRTQAESSTVTSSQQLHASCMFWVTPNSPLIDIPNTPRTPWRTPRADTPGVRAALPDPSAWSVPPLGPAAAVRREDGKNMVLFGIMTDSDTMHVILKKQYSLMTSADDQLRVLRDITDGLSTWSPPPERGRPWIPGLLRSCVAMVRLLPDGHDPGAMAMQVDDSRAVGLMLNTQKSKTMFMNEMCANRFAADLQTAHGRVVGPSCATDVVSQHVVRLALDIMNEEAGVSAVATALGGRVVRFERCPGGGGELRAVEVCMPGFSPVIATLEDGTWGGTRRRSVRDVAVVEEQPEKSRSAADAVVREVLKHLPDSTGKCFWESVLSSPGSADRIRMARLACSRRASEIARDPPPSSRAVWDCALGEGAWERFCEHPLETRMSHSSMNMVNSLEVTSGRALVRPPVHPALGAWEDARPLDSGRDGFAIAMCGSGPCALVISWSIETVMQLEWVGSATLRGVPVRSRGWRVRLLVSDRGVLWNEVDATTFSKDKLSALCESVTSTGATFQTGPRHILVDWAAVRGVELDISDVDGRDPLWVKMAPVL